MIKTKKPICPSGYNLKNAYKTKRGNIIQSRCIQNTGLISPGKSINKKTNLSIKTSNVLAVAINLIVVIIFLLTVVPLIVWQVSIFKTFNIISKRYKRWNASIQNS